MPWKANYADYLIDDLGTESVMTTKMKLIIKQAFSFKILIRDTIINSITTERAARIYTIVSFHWKQSRGERIY